MKKKLSIQKQNANNCSIFVLIIIVDQLTKLLSINNDVIIIPNILKFAYIQNTGAIFGIFPKNIVLIIDIVAIICILIYFKKIERNKMTNVAFVLIISGSISNLIDRIFRGYVIDFIKVIILDNLPIVNLADISILIGSIIFIIVYFRGLLNKKENF